MVNLKKKTNKEPIFTHFGGVGKITFSSGATRSADADDVAYDLVSPWAFERLAKIYAEGAKVHGPRNWEKGQPISVVANHLLRHWILWQQEDRTEDHLAKVAWGLFAMMHFEKTRPDLFEEEER